MARKLIATTEEMDSMRRYFAAVGYGVLPDTTLQAQRRMIQLLRDDPDYLERRHGKNPT